MIKKLMLTACLVVAACVNGWACTNFIVGKKASADGSVIVSYSADSYGMFGFLAIIRLPYMQRVQCVISTSGILVSIWDR